MEYYFFFDRCSVLESFWFSSMLTASLGCASTYCCTLKQRFQAQAFMTTVFILKNASRLERARYMIPTRFK